MYLMRILFSSNHVAVQVYEMPDYIGDEMRKTKKETAEDGDKPFQYKWNSENYNRKIHIASLALDEHDIMVLKRYGQGAYAEQLKQLETDIEECVKKI
ncbi:hypothetical protein X798_05912 [Onchocerca flexuosa]|uniref:Uncharacterized protein n=1 Tax=Onchocerca flexuosa TaxID=387005 RepID=A0A238BP06_9BILA|nr:hypothetical protein X798_05912 [Onchocerca flexuosa]